MTGHQILGAIVFLLMVAAIAWLCRPRGNPAHPRTCRCEDCQIWGAPD